MIDAKLGNLPPVAFVDPNFGTLGVLQETDEHPPADILAGQYFVTLIRR
jgi:hypothetical protein